MVPRGRLFRFLFRFLFRNLCWFPTELKVEFLYIPLMFWRIGEAFEDFFDGVRKLGANLLAVSKPKLA